MSQTNTQNAQDLIDHVSFDIASVYRINKYQFVVLNMLVCSDINYYYLLDPRYPIQLLREQLNPPSKEASQLARGYYDLFLNKRDVQILSILLGSVRELSMDSSNFKGLNAFIEYWVKHQKVGRFNKMYDAFLSIAMQDKIEYGTYDLG